MSTDRIIQIVLALAAAGGLTFGGQQQNTTMETVQVLTELAHNYSEQLEECRNGTGTD